MTRRSRVAALVASVCALGAPVVAGASVEIRSVDTGSYPHAQATVITSKPSKEAPQLTEGGKPAAGVLAKNLGESRSICLAVDHSRSMRGVPLTEAVVAAQAFVAAKLPTDRICVTSFATKPLLIAPFTDSEAEASAALASIKVDPVKGTALYDDVRLASQTLAEEDGRARIIILVTDGNETLSSATLADAIKGAQEAETTVYVVAIESKAFTPGPLRYLAKRTGGRYYGAPSPSALQGIYAELAAELKRTWRLDYVTSGRPGESPKLVAYMPGLGRDSARAPIAATAEVEEPGGLLPAAAYGKGGSTGLGLLVGLLILLAVALVFASANADRVRAQVQKHIAPKPKRAKKGREKKERLQSLAGLFQLTEQGLGNTRVWLKLSRMIERADLQLKTAELFYMSAGSCIVLGLLATAVGSSGLLSLASLVIGALIPLAFVWMKAHRRLAAFENQLPDLLIGIAASLKAGHSFKQALQAIVDEGVEPAGKEFKRVLTETRLGRPLDDALNDMAERVGSGNLSFIVTAVAVQSQVGGSLASLFDMVADTVRNRQQFARKIKALTAMGRMSAYVLVGLPFFLCGALTLLNPTYMAPLFQTSSGHKMIVLSLVMMGIGSLLLKKIVSFKGDDHMMLLVIALLCLAGSIYMVAEYVTLPARERMLSFRRANAYGRRSMKKAAMQGSLRERALVPAMERAARAVLRINPKMSVELVNMRLMSAGLARRVSPVAFLAAKLFAAVAGLVLGILLFSSSKGPVMGFALGMGLAAVGFIGPDFILNKKIRARQERLSADLPDALDLLAVSVEAGLGFDAAVVKITEQVEGPLGEEFALTLNEMRIGESRQDALKKLAERAGIPEIGAFARAIIQADQFGISLGRILRVQAVDTRHRRQIAAEEKAMKAPVKMLFPTVIFIFPSMFIVILGPAFLNLGKILEF